MSEAWAGLRLWLWRTVGRALGIQMIDIDEGGWMTMDCEENGIHVIPLGDKIEHSTIKDECLCGPTPELVRSDSDMPDVYMYTHSSLDGRELTER